MPINCQFNLTSLSSVFYTGEQVSGTLVLTVAKKKPLQLEGKFDSQLPNGCVVFAVLIRYHGNVFNLANSSLLSLSVERHQHLIDWPQHDQLA